MEDIRSSGRYINKQGGRLFWRVKTFGVPGRQSGPGFPTTVFGLSVVDGGFASTIVPAPGP